jgi:hypothetical protein
MRKSQYIAACVSLSMAGIANAAVPDFRAACPTGILVAGGGGTVFINGHQAQVKQNAGSSFSASAGDVSVDFAFEGGEPSLSYTAAHGANGMCTVTKFQPAAAPESRQSSGAASNQSMSAECTGYASEKFGVRPAYVSVHPAFRDHGMYSMYGNADDQNFICTFDGKGKFVGVDASGG